MAISLKGRDFLTLKDFSPREIQYLLELSKNLKRKKQMGIKGDLLEGKNVVLFFEKTSTRTRCSFEVAVHDEGGNVTFLGKNDSQFGKKESVEDTAKVIERFYDGIEFRGFEHQSVEELAKHASIPVWNGLTDLYHPTQILADFLTVEEYVNKPLHQVVFTYVGDARNNMCNSLMIGAAKMGMTFRAIAPKELWADRKLVEEMEEVCNHTGASIEFSDDIKDVKGSDVIYTDVWVSMGEEDQFEERIKLLRDYQVDMDMIELCENDEMIFLHCLPSNHDTETDIGKDVAEKYGLKEMEVTDEVFRSKYSRVFDQAENRMHTIKAVMVATIGK